MSESRNDGRNAGAGQPQNLSVLAQYVKDLSFENPGAPQSLRGRNTQPTINISLNVHASPVVENEVEVELKTEVRATDGDKVLFAIELVYAGIFRLTNIPADTVQPLIMIECPRLLFPFARQIISDASRKAASRRSSSTRSISSRSIGSGSPTCRRGSATSSPDARAVDSPSDREACLAAPGRGARSPAAGRYG